MERPGGRGSEGDRLSDAASAYEGVATAWASGPSRVYDRLAEAIVAMYPDSLRLRRIVDVGAGTGAVARLLIKAGAVVTAVDVARDMVEHMRAHGIDAVLGDMLQLPFADGSFDGVVSAFAVSHVDDPARALAEAGRVVRADGAVVASVFAAQAQNPVKDVIDSTAEDFGYVRPAWYAHLKYDTEPLTSTPEKLRACAESAGLTQVLVTEQPVDTGVEAPEDIVAARVGMAHLAPFVAALTPDRRAALVAEACAAVARDPQPLRPAVLIMTSRVPA